MNQETINRLVEDIFQLTEEAGAAPEEMMAALSTIIVENHNVNSSNLLQVDDRFGAGVLCLMQLSEQKESSRPLAMRAIADEFLR